MSPPSRRPRVLANFATTLDGKIAPAAQLRRGPVALSRGAEDHARMRALRARCDAILIGAGNLRVDDPDLALGEGERERRRHTGHLEPMRIVLTRSGEGLTPKQAVFDAHRGGPTLVAHASVMPDEVRDKLAPHAELKCAGEKEVDLEELLAWLWHSRGVRVLLCEGGGIVSEQFFRARAIDELYLTIVPRILGGAEAPTLASGLGFRMDELPDAELAAIERVGDELFLRYTFAWS